MYKRTYRSFNALTRCTNVKVHNKYSRKQASTHRCTRTRWTHSHAQRYTGTRIHRRSSVGLIQKRCYLFLNRFERTVGNSRLLGISAILSTSVLSNKACEFSRLLCTHAHTYVQVHNVRTLTNLHTHTHRYRYTACAH